MAKNFASWTILNISKTFSKGYFENRKFKVLEFRGKSEKKIENTKFLDYKDCNYQEHSTFMSKWNVRAVEVKKKKHWESEFVYMLCKREKKMTP